MKKVAQYLIVLLALAFVSAAFAGVGGHTKPSGGLTAPTQTQTL